MVDGGWWMVDGGWFRLWACGRRKIAENKDIGAQQLAHVLRKQPKTPDGGGGWGKGAKGGVRVVGLDGCGLQVSWGGGGGGAENNLLSTSYKILGGVFPVRILNSLILYSRREIFLGRCDT